MGYATIGWIVVLCGLTLYAAILVIRERRLARQVPPQRRRWMDSSDE